MVKNYSTNNKKEIRNKRKKKNKAKTVLKLLCFICKRYRLYCGGPFFSLSRHVVRVMLLATKAIEL